ncbi:MAG: response regulator [Proteobacteria bacterium]|nr:response regulator [Pseudomonadota bacterium]
MYEPPPDTTPRSLSSGDPLAHLAGLCATLLGADIAIICQRNALGYRCAARFGAGADLIVHEAFCEPFAHDLAPLTCHDARSCEPLSIHPNVAGAPHVASVLSVPISDSLNAIGAVCIMSTRPRTWTETDTTSLFRIAAIAAGLIHGGTLATAMDTAKDGIAITDADGVFTYMNQAHAKQFGYDAAAELTGRPWMVLYDPAQAQIIAEEAFSTIAQVGVWTGEAIGRRRDNTPLFQEITLSGLPSGGVICATRDVTERKRLEVKSRKHAEMRASAEAASAAKSAFLAQMSHEIRTPLNGVVGLAGALRDTHLSAEQEQIVGLIESCSETLDHLVSDILDLSRIEAGKTKFDVSPFDLARVVRDATSIVSSAGEAKQVRVETLLEGAARNAAFMGDAVRIKQLLLNLISNALKFTAAGTVRVRVAAPDVATGARGDVVLEVTDTGIGFDETDAARLFRRFEQGDDLIGRTYGGTGLGLSICQALAEGMGGHISCSSAIGLGSTFTVTLPLERAAPPASVALDPIGQAPRGVRVLVAEDHLANRRVVEIILSAAGAELTFAANGFEAVEARRLGDYDVVLMDMLMPVMSGLEAIAAIRALERRENLPAIPIAVLSANVVERHRELASRAGADLFLAKPITPAVLLSAIETMLQNRARAA